MAETKKVEKTGETVKRMYPASMENHDDIQVCINGKWTIVQRGKEVEIPAEVAEVIDNKFRMEQLAYERQQEQSSNSKNI